MSWNFKVPGKQKLAVKVKLEALTLTDNPFLTFLRNSKVSTNLVVSDTCFFKPSITTVTVGDSKVLTNRVARLWRLRQLQLSIVERSNEIGRNFTFTSKSVFPRLNIVWCHCSSVWLHPATLPTLLRSSQLIEVEHSVSFISSSSFVRPHRRRCRPRCVRLYRLIIRSNNA